MQIQLKINLIFRNFQFDHFAFRWLIHIHFSNIFVSNIIYPIPKYTQMSRCKIDIFYLQLTMKMMNDRLRVLQKKKKKEQNQFQWRDSHKMLNTAFLNIHWTLYIVRGTNETDNRFLNWEQKDSWALWSNDKYIKRVTSYYGQHV